ncbi:MAG: sulfatase-like hydrolase/transferase [Saprospiraceae bacterium]|nr:sulfatase-like hydrolase/transferase [Saprospiraceae bacterium]
MRIYLNYVLKIAFFISLTISVTTYAQVERPNLILIFADDLGIESIKPYGGHSTVTPNIDRIVSEGMIFTHCFANPACSPSRAEVLTGMYPTDTGFKHVLSYYDDTTFLDPNRFSSFANQMKRVGYATAVAGKWNLSHLEKNNTVLNFGFDEHCLWQMFDKHGVKRSRYYLPHFRINNKIVESDIRDRFGPDVMCDFMIEFIGKNRDKPFLIYYPSLIPHTPYVKAPENEDFERLPDHEQKNGPECFPEMVNYLDKNVGRLLNAVEEHGLSENTIIIFCADNGTAKQVTTIWGKEKIRVHGGKMTMTDRGARVPLIVKWPDKIKPGTQCHDLIELADFLHTFCDITNAPLPIQKVRGQSFLPQLLGKKVIKKQWVHIEYKENRQIRTRKWIYTANDDLIKVNKLGVPENQPEKKGTYQRLRRKFRNLL